jgi:hypothetical protein
MKPEEFRPVMVRVLSRCSGKKLGLEEVVDQLIGAMQDLEAVMGSSGKAVLIETPPTKQVQNLQTDISQRLSSADNTNDGRLVEIWTKEQLAAFARDQMPSLLSVQPQGFNVPFQIQKFVQAAPGDLGFVQIIYQQPEAPMTDQSGQRIGPAVKISTTDKRLDADELTVDIIKQAESMYTKTPRVLVPKMPPTMNRPGDLSNAIGLESTGFPLGKEPQGAGEDNMTLPLTPELSNQWKSQRQRGE